MKKNIWLISKYASPPQYGVGSRLFYFAKEFSLIQNVTLISSDSNHLANYPVSNNLINIEEYQDLKHVWLKTLKYNVSSSAKRFLSWLDFDRKLYKYLNSTDESPDVVIISSLSLTSIRFGLYLQKKYNTKLIFEILFNYSIFPLRIFTLLGLGVSATSFSLGIFFILKALIYGSAIQGWTAVVTLISFLSGLILIILFMMGEYLIRVNRNLLSKNKSYRSIIKEAIENLEKLI
jgi:hypothetical protein